MKTNRIISALLVLTLMAGCGQKTAEADIAEAAESTPAIVETVDQQEELPPKENQSEKAQKAVENSTVDALTETETEPVSKENQETQPEISSAPEQQAASDPTQAPAATPAPAPAASLAYGAIPFSLSEFQYDWWSIDSSDDAYWACANNINAMRRAAGLSELAVDGGLSAIANSRCEQIVSSGDFSHSGMCTAGEILGENYNSASSVCNAWQASPSHYNQITGSYSSMGIGCVFEQSGQTIWCVVLS